MVLELQKTCDSVLLILRLVLSKIVLLKMSHVESIFSGRQVLSTYSSLYLLWNERVIRRRCRILESKKQAETCC
jgi:hypothetical protein